jgi:hypothetical protein
MKKITFSIIFIFVGIINAQAAYRDFRTKASGNWNSLSTWQMYNGSWLDATWIPDYNDEDITILAGYSVNITAAVTVDQVNVKGNLTLNSGVTFTIKDGSGTDVFVDYLSDSYAYFYVYGTIINEGTLSKTDGVIYFYDNSIYKHAQDGGSVEDASWSTNSTCEITGYVSSTPTNLDQNFGNFTWNCSGQTSTPNLSTIPIVYGNFSLISTGSSASLTLSSSTNTNMFIYGDYIQQGGNFYPSNGSADDILYIGGDFNMTGGKLGGPPSGSGSTTIVFNKNGIQTFTSPAAQDALSYKLNFQVNSNSILDIGSGVLGNSLYTSGTFNLSSGAGLMTANANGIASIGASGCVQVTGTRTYSQEANYTFYASGSQSTGNGLSTPLSGTVTIGSTSNTTNLSFTNTTAINNSLIIVNGTVATSNISYGSSAILEYRGTSAQTTGNNEWPSNTVPNLKINNSAGVTLNSGKTISTNLNLYSGALSIGDNNTLSVNGTISLTSGSLTGYPTHTSNILFGGSGSTGLPSVLNGLNNLTINRSGATISLTGNVTVYGTMTMAAGAFSLGGGTLSYGAAGTLKYTGAYSTTNSEFPASSGPFNLYIDNNVNLHADRGIDGTLTFNSGQFAIGAHTLTLNGATTISSGTLAGGGSSNIIVGGASFTAIDLPAVSLNNLSLNRTNSGVRLAGNVSIDGTMTMTAGSLALNGRTFSYGASGTLLYNGSAAQVTSASEFPTSNGPYNLTADNTVSVSLTDDRAINGTLTLSKGAFVINDNVTLSLNGNAISGTPTLLQTTSLSSLSFGGSSSGVSIPSSVLNLKNLTILNNNGVTLNSKLKLSGTASVYGYLNFSVFTISDVGSFQTFPGAKLGIGRPDGVSGNITVSGAKTISSLTDYDFNCMQPIVTKTTNFLPTTPPNTIRNLNVSTSGTLDYIEDMTVSGNLLIMPMSKLQINAGKTLTVDGLVNLTNPDCLILASPSNHGPAASLIANGNIFYSLFATAEVQRYIENWTGPTDGWHLLSSPIEDHLIIPNFIDPTPENYDFYKWDETTTLWLNQKVPENNITTFIPGEGYLVAYNTTNQLRTFTGKLNNLDYNFTNLSYTPDQPNRGWHLLGNPFPSAVKWNDGNWSLSNVAAICKVWDENGGTYLDIDPLGHIPAMNGFMIWVSESTNAIKIPLAARVHDVSTNWYKKSENTTDRLQLTAYSKENNTYQRSVVQFNPSSSSGFDFSCDSYFLAGIDQAPELYSVALGNIFLSTNTLPYADKNKPVPIGFKKGSSTNYTLNTEGTQSFDPDFSIILEDKKLNTRQDLRLNPIYAFTSNNADNPDRFALHFSNAYGIGNKVDDPDFQVFTSGNSIFIESPEFVPLESEVRVYSLLGQEVMHTLIKDKHSRIDLQNPSGYYLVKIRSHTGVFTTKVYMD